jgi:hypothetical protein
MAINSVEEEEITKALRNSWGDRHMVNADPAGWLKGWESIARYHGLETREEVQSDMDDALIVAVPLTNGRLYSNTG